MRSSEMVALAHLLAITGLLALHCRASADSDRTITVESRGVVVLDAAPDDLISPCVIRDEKQLRMWYAKTHYLKADDPLTDRLPWLEGETHTWEINYATSSDGIEWEQHGVVAGPGLCSEMRLTQMTMPCVIRDGDGYRMWVTGREKGSTLYRIFQTTSADGVSWGPLSLCIDVGPQGQTDDRNVTSCSVVKRGDTYLMWYGGQCAADMKLRTHYAESDDGIEWRKLGVAVDTGEPGAPDGRRAYRPCVAGRGGEYTMLYCGINDDTLRGDYVTMLATSPDGREWTKCGLVMSVGAAGQPDSKRCYDTWWLPGTALSCRCGTSAQGTTVSGESAGQCSN